MMKALKLYGCCLGILVLLDVIWLGFIANNFYKSQIGALLRVHINWPAAIAVWALIALGLLFFVFPLIHSAPAFKSFFYGALYGFILYGVYDLTNLAMLAHWPLSITIIDILWGAFLSGLLAVIMNELARVIK